LCSGSDNNASAVLILQLHKDCLCRFSLFLCILDVENLSAPSMTVSSSFVRIHRRNSFSRNDVSFVEVLNSDAANMPVNAGRLRQLHLLHQAYGAFYNESSIVRTTVGRIAPVECTYADVSTALFAVLCSSLTLMFR
jgi:hypothetical protein